MPSDGIVERWLASQDVCPWGKAAAAQGQIIVHHLSPGLVGDIALRRVVCEFAGGTSGTSLVIVLSYDRAAKLEELEQLAGSGWLRLREASLRLFNSDRPRIEREAIARHELQQTLDRNCPVRPHPLFRGRPVMIIALGPAYPSSHPRYSPLPVLCAVWTHDLAAVPLRPKEAHRLRMAALAGQAYDADELVLRQGALR